MSRNTFVLKIQREICHPKSFGTFEKRAPGLCKNCVGVTYPYIEERWPLSFPKTSDMDV